MAGDREHLQVVFQRICQALQEAPDIEELILFCDHEAQHWQHAADLTSNAMRLAIDVWYIEEMNNLMRRYWSKKKCGWKCCVECDLGNEDNGNAYKQAAELFMQTWKRVQEWKCNM